MSSLQFALRGLGLADSLVWPLLLAGLTYLVWSRGTDVGLSPRACRIIAVFLTIGTISAFVTANTVGHMPPESRLAGSLNPSSE